MRNLNELGLFLLHAFLLYMVDDVLQIPASGVCALLLDKCGRQPILMIKNRKQMVFKVNF